MTTMIDGFNAWEIAIELESFTAKFLSTDILDNHLQLCGGEEQNGFELWRNLNLQHAGSSQESTSVGFRSS